MQSLPPEQRSRSCVLANSLAALPLTGSGARRPEFYVTPGGEVGSIGVWQAHFDYSQALATDGVTPTLISMESTRSVVTPTRRWMSRLRPSCSRALTITTWRSVKVLHVAGAFQSLRCGNGMGQGRVLGAEAAIEQNMVDGVATPDDAISGRFCANGKPQTKPQASRIRMAMHHPAFAEL